MTADPEVTIEFKGRHDHITERMQTHAVRKLSRLSRYGDRLLRIEIVADHAHKNPEVEIIAHQRRGAPLVAKDRGSQLENQLVRPNLEAMLDVAKGDALVHTDEFDKARDTYRIAQLLFYDDRWFDIKITSVEKARQDFDPADLPRGGAPE